MTPLQNAVKTAEGVMVNGFVISPCVEQCTGCERVREFDEEKFCSSYPDPAYKWPRPLLPPKLTRSKLPNAQPKAVNLQCFAAFAAYPRKGCLLH